MSKLDLALTVDIPEVEAQLRRIADVISGPDWMFEGGQLRLDHLVSTQFTHLTGGKVMFRVPATQADVPYAIELPRVVNAEGGTVPGWTVVAAIASDNDAAVTIVPDPAVPNTGVAVIGSAGPAGEPATATVTVTFTATHPTDTDSPRTGLLAEVFVVEAGDEVGFAGGALSFSGITPEPTPTP